MIIKNNKEISSVFKGTTAIERIYKGVTKVWEAFVKLIVQGILPLTLNNSAGKNLINYQIYGNSKQEELPDGYTQLEYIESTGTQYIDTGINPDRTSRFELNFIQTTHNTSIMGAYSNNNNRVQAFRGGVSGTDSSFFEFRTFSDTSHRDYDSNILYSSDTKFNVVFDIKNLKGIVNGDVVNLTDMEGGDISSSVWLFCANNAGSIATASNSKLYSYEHYKNDNLIQKLIPCKNSSNVIGMYDLVNGVFYTNQGTGTFTAGPVAPTPNAPIEIESVGDKTKNLWNSTLIAGCMLFRNGAYNNYPGYVCNDTPILVEAGETYTISADEYNNPSGAGFVFFNNGTFVSSLETTSLTVTIPSRVNQLYYNFRKASSPSSLSPSDITNVQFEKGSSATSYEPYGYKIPIKVNGKNLFSVDKNLQGNFTKIKDGNRNVLKYTDIANQIIMGKNIKFKERQRYTYSFEVCRPDIVKDIMFWVEYEDGSSYETSKTTISNINEYVKVIGNSHKRSNGNSLDSELTVKKIINGSNWNRLIYIDYDTIQIEAGTTATKYEPYFERIENLYLSEPLRKYNDKADYIDFETQKVYRNIGNIVLDGSEDENWVIDSSYTTPTKRTVIAKSNPLVVKDSNYISNYFIQGSSTSNRLVLVANNIYLSLDDTITGILETDDNTAKLTKMKAWLSTHNTILICTRNAPTEESIELPDILLNKGTNIVDVNTEITPSNMEVKYYAKGA